MHGPAPRSPYPPLPLLPGQRPRVRTVWTRLAHALAVGALVLTPWLLFRVVIGVVFLPADAELAPEERSWVLAYLAYVVLELVLALALALGFWLLGQQLRRREGRPTRRVTWALVSSTIVLAVLVVDAFTFAVVRFLAQVPDGP